MEVLKSEQVHNMTISEKRFVLSAKQNCRTRDRKSYLMQKYNVLNVQLFLILNRLVRRVLADVKRPKALHL